MASEYQAATADFRVVLAFSHVLVELQCRYVHMHAAQCAQASSLDAACTQHSADCPARQIPLLISKDGLQPDLCFIYVMI